MSEYRKMILNMLKEGRITVEEADTLLSATEGKTIDTPQIFKEGFSKLEKVVKNLGASLENLTPVIEKKIDNFLTNIKTSSLNRHEITEPIVITENINKISVLNEQGDILVFGENRKDIELKVIKLITAKNNEAALKRAEELKLDWSIKNDELIVNTKEIMNLGLNKDIINIVLSIPKNIDLYAKSLTGDLNIKNLNNSKVYLLSNTGDIDINEVSTSELNVEIDNGDLYINDFDGNLAINTTNSDLTINGTLKGSSKINNINGDIKVNALVCDNLEIVNTNGDIEVSLQPDTVGNIIVSNTNGDIVFKGESFKHSNLSNIKGDIQSIVKVKNDSSLDISTNSGDIVIRLIDGTNSSIAANSRLGEVECSIKIDNLEKDIRYLKGKLGSGEGKISLQSSNGNIFIKEF